MHKRISPCPTIEAIIQINCTFAVDRDVVVGLIYSLLNGKEEGLELRIERLPILNLPEEIRRNDPNLKDKPWYKINYGEYYILIGFFGVAFGINQLNNRWSSFKSFSIQILNDLKGNVIKGISAISLKHLDFFHDINIFEKTKCQINLNGKQITSVPTIFKTELLEDKFVRAIQITNGVQLRNDILKIDDYGSLIETNLFTRHISLDNFNQVIDNARALQERSLLGLLSDEYLATFEIEDENE